MKRDKKHLVKLASVRITDFSDLAVGEKVHDFAGESPTREDMEAIDNGVVTAVSSSSVTIQFENSRKPETFSHLDDLRYLSKGHIDRVEVVRELSERSSGHDTIAELLMHIRGLTEQEKKELLRSRDC